MKLYKAYLLIAALFIAGCDNDEDKKYLLEDSLIVSTKSSDIVQKKDGDIYMFGGEGWRVIVTTDTEVFVTRGSCSGLDKVSATEIRQGYTIFFKYEAKNVDYSYSPSIVRPKVIEAYSPECIQGLTNDISEL